MKILASPLLALSLLTAMTNSASGQSYRLDLEQGVGSWQTVLDGVMGGRSTGRVSQPEPGVLLFSGDLSLENNGGFSQMRTGVLPGSFEGSEGILLECMGDGRTYNFNIRCSNVRVMAGSYQQPFETRDGEWTRVRLPLNDFQLVSFGRRVRSAPDLEAGKISSIGVTLSDKKPGAFGLKIRSIEAVGTDREDAKPTGAGTDLASVARDAGLKKLLSAVQSAQLELPESPVTILAPTDAAFDALPEEVALQVEADPKGALRTVLTYHVIEGAVPSSEVLNRRALTTLLGQQLAIDSSVFSAPTIGGAGLVMTDVPFDGGVIHVIDKVLVPELRSIVELAAETEPLKSLVTALTAADLAGALGGQSGPWTVFAPVDTAFAKLPKETLNSLLEPRNIEQLTSVLGLHVAKGRISARELSSKRYLSTLSGARISTGLEGGKLMVGGANLIAADIQAANGVVHLIDSVITGPADDEKPRKQGDVYAEALEVYALAVKRGVALFNSGNEEACAAVYEVAADSIIRLGRGRLDGKLIERLEADCVEAARGMTWKARAWGYRRALDRAYRELRSRTAPA